jgi:hypothetical protein
VGETIKYKPEFTGNFLPRICLKEQTSFLSWHLTLQSRKTWHHSMGIKVAREFYFKDFQKDICKLKAQGTVCIKKKKKKKVPGENASHDPRLEKTKTTVYIYECA